VDVSTNLFTKAQTPPSFLSQSRAETPELLERIKTSELEPWCFTILASVSLAHLPCLFTCFYESVSCVYAFFSTGLSACLARAACFVFSSVFIITYLFPFFFFYKFNRHLCHGTYSCTHNPANMPFFLLHLHLHFSNPCVCVSKHIYAFPSSSIFIHTYPHIHMYVLCSVLYPQPYFFFSCSTI